MAELTSADCVARIIDLFKYGSKPELRNPKNWKRISKSGNATDGFIRMFQSKLDGLVVKVVSSVEEIQSVDPLYLSDEDEEGEEEETKHTKALEKKAIDKLVASGILEKAKPSGKTYYFEIDEENNETIDPDNDGEQNWFWIVEKSFYDKKKLFDDQGVDGGHFDESVLPKGFDNAMESVYSYKEGEKYTEKLEREAIDKLLGIGFLPLPGGLAEERLKAKPKPKKKKTSGLHLKIDAEQFRKDAMDADQDIFEVCADGLGMPGFSGLDDLGSELAVYSLYESASMIVHTEWDIVFHPEAAKHKARWEKELIEYREVFAKRYAKLKAKFGAKLEAEFEKTRTEENDCAEANLKTGAAGCCIVNGINPDGTLPSPVKVTDGPYVHHKLSPTTSPAASASPLKLEDLKDGMTVHVRWGRAGAHGAVWESEWITSNLEVVRHAGPKATRDGVKPGEIMYVGATKCPYGEYYPKRDYSIEFKGQFTKEDYYMEIQEMKDGEDEEKKTTEATTEATEMIKSVLGTFAATASPVTTVEIDGKEFSLAEISKADATIAALPATPKKFTLAQFKDGTYKGRIGDRKPDGTIEWRDWADYELDIVIREGGYITNLTAKPELPEVYDQTHWDATKNVFVGDESAFEVEGLISTASVAAAVPSPRPAAGTGPSTVAATGAGAFAALLGGGRKKKSVSSPFGLSAMGGSGREVAKADPPPPPEKQAWADYQRELKGLE